MFFKTAWKCLINEQVNKLERNVNFDDLFIILTVQMLTSAIFEAQNVYFHENCSEFNQNCINDFKNLPPCS